jgi:hypothetical protein
MWTAESVAAAMESAFTGDGTGAGFVCEDTLALAGETIGFGSDS